MHVLVNHGHHEFECHDRICIELIAMTVNALVPSALINGMIASGVYSELFVGVTSGGILVPSTIESKLDVRSAFSSISKLSNVLSLFDTLVFFAISVLVGAILQYLDIGLCDPSSQLMVHFGYPPS